MGKYIIVFPYNSNKKKLSTDTCCNVDESREHYSKPKEPVIKDHIQYGSIYMKCPEYTNLRRLERLEVNEE